MALLKINGRMSGLKSNVSEQVYEGSALYQILAACRAAASEALPLVAGMGPIERQGRLQVSAEVGDLTSPADLGSPLADGTTGFVDLTVCVVVDEALAYRHRASNGPAVAYVDAVLAGMSAAFDALPNGGADFFAAIGITDAAAQIRFGTSVVLAA